MLQLSIAGESQGDSDGEEDSAGESEGESESRRESDGESVDDCKVGSESGGSLSKSPYCHTKSPEFFICISPL